MHKNAFMLPVSFTGPYIKDEPKFPQQKKKQLILQKTVSGTDKAVNFKDFSRPYKEIKYFSRRLLKFKTFSRLSEPR